MATHKKFKVWFSFGFLSLPGIKISEVPLPVRQIMTTYEYVCTHGWLHTINTYIPNVQCTTVGLPTILYPATKRDSLERGM
jgi:hypothetical protein